MRETILYKVIQIRLYQGDMIKYSKFAVKILRGPKTKTDKGFVRF
jgi:hypothetical protein